MAPRKKAPTGPRPVVATEHDDKRSVIPTADLQDLVPPEVEEPVKVRWPRDHSLDPQLVWKGKDDEAEVLEGDAPPLYIQEKVDPRVLVENLRRTAKAGEPEPELTCSTRSTAWRASTTWTSTTTPTARVPAGRTA